MKDGDEFLKWSRRVWNYNRTLIKRYKRLLPHKNRAVLLDLSLKIQSYDFGILMQAKADFRKNNLENKSIKDFIKQEEETYSKSKISKIKKKVDKFFKSSFDNERSNKIKDLVLNENLSYIIPFESENYISEEDYQPVSLKGDFEENLLPQYNRLRENKAKTLQKKLNLTENFILKLHSLAFDEIVSMANRKSTLHNLNRNLSVSTASVIAFLEQSIKLHFPNFLRDLGFGHKVVSLVTLRNNSQQRFNTVCWRCNKPLFKRDNKHYCKKREKRSCYEARLKESKQSGFPAAILRTKNKCDNCDRYSSHNNIHKHEGVQMQFCSDRCWETFRKRVFRKKKKSIK